MGQFAEKITETFDHDSGISTITKQTYWNKKNIEPTDEYIKVSRYLHTIFAYNDIPLRLVGISLCIAERMEFKTNKVYLLKSDKEEIIRMLGYKERERKNGQSDTNSVDKLIAECKKYGIIRPTNTRGLYEVNGYLFSTGSNVDTRELQARFDFDSGSVKATVLTTNKLTGEKVRRAIYNLQK